MLCPEGLTRGPSHFPCTAICTYLVTLCSLYLREDLCYSTSCRFVLMSSVAALDKCMPLHRAICTFLMSLCLHVMLARINIVGRCPPQRHAVHYNILYVQVALSVKFLVSCGVISL